MTIEEGDNRIAKEIFRQCQDGREVYFGIGKDDQLVIGIRGNDKGETIRISKCMTEKIVEKGNDPDGAIQSLLKQAGMEVDRMIEDKSVDEYYGTEASNNGDK